MSTGSFGSCPICLRGSPCLCPIERATSWATRLVPPLRFAANHPWLDQPRSFRSTHLRTRLAMLARPCDRFAIAIAILDILESTKSDEILRLMTAAGVGYGLGWFQL